MFRDRADAGRQLAARLAQLRDRDPVVLGLPRGGVVVAAPVAGELGALLDVIVVRKLGAPQAPEVAMGALGEGGVLVRNEDVVRRSGVGPAGFEQVRRREQAALEARVGTLRGRRTPVPLADRCVVVVDDGIATGATARAACAVARAAGAAHVVLAAPVIAVEALPLLQAVADELVSVEAPSEFGSVGQWYDDFRQVTDDEVVALLQLSSRAGP